MSLYDELVKWRWGFPSWKLRFKILGILVVVVLMFPKVLEIYRKFNEPIEIQQPSSRQMVQGDNNKQITTTGDNSPVTYIERQENYPPQKDNSLPSSDEITAEGRRAAPWHNEYGGVRRSYQRLLHWRDTINDPVRKDWIITEIEKVEKSYPVDVMRLSIDQWGYICVQHVDCEKGYEPPTGFSAQNAISHLGFNRDLWQERARAACILRNIKTASDKDSVDKEDFYEKLISLMGEKESSLCVSKMALETYKDLTGFSSDGVFDFAGAVKHWGERKDEILKINF